jgi:hypothetical protein
MKKILQIIAFILAQQAFGQSIEFLPNKISVKTPFSTNGFSHSNLDGSKYFYSELSPNNVYLASNTAINFAVNNGSPAIRISDVENLITFNTFTKLGAPGPAIKTKLLTGITASGTGSSASSEIVHGITNPEKILDVKLVVDLGPAGNVTDEYTRSSGYQVSLSFNGAFIYVSNSIANSINIRNKPFKLYITYEQ